MGVGRCQTCFSDHHVNSSLFALVIFSGVWKRPSGSSELLRLETWETVNVLSYSVKSAILSVEHFHISFCGREGRFRGLEDLGFDAGLLLLEH